MAEDIPIQIDLQGVEKILSKLNSLTGGFSKMLSGLEADAKNTAVVMDEITKAIERQDAAVAAAKKRGDQAPASAKDMDVNIPKGKGASVLGEGAALALDRFKDRVSPEDFKAINDAITEYLAKPLAEIPKTADKAGEGISKMGEKGMTAFQKLSGASKNFAAALADASIGSAVEGINDLAGSFSTLASSMGPAGAAVGGFATAVAAVTAALVGFDVAAMLVANRGRDIIIEMDNLGKSAGMSAAGMYALQNGFEDLGGSAETLQTAIKGINNRLLSGWPEIRREVRDSADTIESAYRRIADAQDKVTSTKREGSLLDEKLRDAQRTADGSDRRIADAQDGRVKAELDYQSALDGRVRAELRVADAQRASAAAGREVDQSQISLRAALVRQEEAAFGVARAYRSVKEAALGVGDAQGNLASDTLSLQQAIYNRDVSRGKRARDPNLEAQFKTRSEDLQIEALRRRVEADKLAVITAKEELKKRKLEAENAEDIQRQADLDAKAARDKVSAAYDGITKAGLDYQEALRGQLTAQMEANAALRRIADSADAYAKAVDDKARNFANVDAVRQEIAGQGRKEAQAESDVRTAQRAYEDAKAKDIPTIMKTLAASPLERAKDRASENPQLVKLEEVDTSKLAQAIVVSASPDGKSKPSTEQIIMKMSELLEKAAKESGTASSEYTTLRSAISKTLAPRADLNDFLDVLTQGPGAISAAKAKNSSWAENRFTPEAIAATRAAEIAKNSVGSAANQQTAEFALGTNPAMEAQYGAIRDLILGLDVKTFAAAIGGATGALQGFTAALKGIRAWTDSLGITKPAEYNPTPAPNTMGPVSPEGTNARANEPVQYDGVLDRLEKTFWSSLLYTLGGGPGKSWQYQSGNGPGTANGDMIERADKDPLVQFFRGLFGTSTPGKQSSAGMLFGTAQADEAPNGPLMKGNASEKAPFIDYDPAKLGQDLNKFINEMEPAAAKNVDAASKIEAAAEKQVEPTDNFLLATEKFAQAVEKFSDAAGKGSAGAGAPTGTGGAGGVGGGGAAPSAPASAPASVGTGRDPRMDAVPMQFRENHRFPPMTGAGAGASAGGGRDPRMNAVPMQFRDHHRFPPMKAGAGAGAGTGRDPRMDAVPMQFRENHRFPPMNNLNIIGKALDAQDAAASDPNKPSWYNPKPRKPVRFYGGPRPKPTGPVAPVPARGNRIAEMQYLYDSIFAADGGLISGPGSGKSDSIPANLSNGEYVVRANAVEHWGVGMMDAINNFAEGGLVMPNLMSGVSSPKMSRGSLNQYALDIRTNDGSFTAMVSGDTMAAISKSAMGAKMKSIGTKPSWYGK